MGVLSSLFLNETRTTVRCTDPGITSSSDVPIEIKCHWLRRNNKNQSSTRSPSLLSQVIWSGGCIWFRRQMDRNVNPDALPGVSSPFAFCSSCLCKTIQQYLCQNIQKKCAFRLGSSCYQPQCFYQPAQCQLATIFSHHLR